jgi:hypothetical protein
MAFFALAARLGIVSAYHRGDRNLELWVERSNPARYRVVVFNKKKLLKITYV